MSVQSIPAHSPGQGGTDRVAPAHHVRPFAAVPLDMLEDVRLNASDFMLVCILLMHARARSTCYPSVRTLAREMRQSERCVQYGLKRLADAGWITSRPASSPTNKTGRELVLTWRVQAGAPGGVQKPYSQGLPRVQGGAPEWRKNPREIEGSALARGGKEKNTQNSPVSQATPSSPPPRRPETPDELKALYIGGGWLDYPEGHVLRRLAEKGLTEAMARARPDAPPGRTPACAPSRTASAPFADTVPSRACRPRS